MLNDFKRRKPTMPADPAAPNDAVKRHYEELPYPPRDPLAERNGLHVTALDHLGIINHYCFSGKLDHRNISVLIAGGGTGDAAIFLGEQLRGTDSRIVYVDISAASMRIAQERARARRLNNIAWIQGSILDLPGMDLPRFDYINCCGVLHHLEDPTAGLRALSAVLKSDGAIGIMVYATHGRTAVYQLQNLLRLINGPDAAMKTRLDSAKRVLASLPPGNWFRRDREAWSVDLDAFGDPGIYDLLLHSRDTSYDVPGLYRLIDGCGLHLVTFTGVGGECKRLYDPATYLRDGDLMARIMECPLAQRQAIAELLSGCIRKHQCYLSFREPPPATSDDPDAIPYFVNVEITGRALGDFLSGRPEGAVSIELRGHGEIEFDNTRCCAEILRHIDGNLTIKEIIEAVRCDVNAQLPWEELLEEFRAIFRTFHAFEIMFVRYKSVPAYRSYREMATIQQE
jgi:SAM-dependent methyltransferase